MNQILFGNWSSDRRKLKVRQTLEKRNMTGDIKTTRNKAVTLIAFLSRIITQKDTEDKLGTKFGQYKL